MNPNTAPLNTKGQQTSGIPHITLPSLSSFSHTVDSAPNTASSTPTAQTASYFQQNGVSTASNTSTNTHQGNGNTGGSTNSYAKTLHIFSVGSGSSVAETTNSKLPGLKPGSSDSTPKLGLSVASFDNPLPSRSESAGTQIRLPVPPAIATPSATTATGTTTGTGTDAVTSASSSSSPSSYKPLNVKDALSYLEQVKLQFTSNPGIYNQFLDIMKDFKSQTIDTPGVIERVSTLFKGYSALIQGFNTFLPQGYKIECSDNPDGPIRVTTPQGSSTLHNLEKRTDGLVVDIQRGTPTPISGDASNNNNNNNSNNDNINSNDTQPLQTLHPPQMETAPSSVTTSAGNTSTGTSAHLQPLPLPQYPPHFVTSSSSPSSATSPAILNPPPPPPPPLSAPSVVSKRPLDVEFSQAINYVNKIKTRFADQPDVYKNFLEILQTYQREQKPIHEVYSQVAILFQNAPDLLDDFKKFLPESSTKIDHSFQKRNMGVQPTPTQVSQGGQQAPLIQNSGKPGIVYGGGLNSYYRPDVMKLTQQQNLPPIGSFSPPVNSPPLYSDESFGPHHNQFRQPSSSDQPRTQSQKKQQTKQQQPMLNLPSLLKHEQTIDLSGQEANEQLKSRPQTQVQQEPPPIIQPPMNSESIPISSLRSPPSHSPYTQPPDILATSDSRVQMDTGLLVPTTATTTTTTTHHPQQQSKQTQQKVEEQSLGPTQHVIEAQYMETAVRPEIDLDPSIVPVVPEPTEPIEDNLTLVEESNFFDRVKKFIGNKQVYTEFLKILNLYSQDLLEVDELVHKVEYYLGSNKELFGWFKEFVGYRDQPKIIENIVHEKHRLDLDLCEACGPSYKRLPKTDTFMPCSGRDDMCWEVLNDEWVGHPVWASEDSGFIAHRKNQYEETLFRIEEERHEYDYYIESNLRTIQTLETIANKIANMSEEEKQVFKLPPGLGGTSLTIYKKVIRKVYDKERGFEVIDALHEYPVIAVPVVLRRLKQKDEEWRRAQREWNKIWRELEQKVYFKSLDHLGLTFKQADKKLLTTKQLLSEISSIKVDQTNKRIHWLTPKPKSQLDYDIKDFEIIFDIIRLAFVFINHCSNYSHLDKERLRDFLKAFIGFFFSIPLSEINEAFVKRGIDPVEGTKLINDGNNADVEDHQSQDGVNNKDKPVVNAVVEEKGEEALGVPEATSKKRPRDPEFSFSLGDILHRTKYQKLKHILREGTTQDHNEDGTTEEVRDKTAEETTQNIVELPEQNSEQSWLLGDMVEKANSDGVIRDRHKFNLFGNVNIYIFIRHLTTLYFRLLEIKDMNEAVTKEINSRKPVQFAEDLNLVSTQLKVMGLDFVGKDCYQEILRLGERLILNDIEHQWFEESLRQAFNNKAFKLYTIDKVTQSLVKHAHTLMIDNKTTEILKLFEADKSSANTSIRDQMLYRLHVRNCMSSTENMFRIEYDRDTRHISIQYISLDDLTLKECQTEQSRWQYYVTSYSLPYPTESVDQKSLRVPFLEKILEFETEHSEEFENDEREGRFNKLSPEGLSQSALKINIDPDTWALRVEPGSIDVYSRKSMNRFPTRSIKTLLSTKGSPRGLHLMNDFLNGENGWKKDLNNSSIETVDKYLEHGPEETEAPTDNHITASESTVEQGTPSEASKIPQTDKPTDIVTDSSSPS